MCLDMQTHLCDQFPRSLEGWVGGNPTPPSGRSQARPTRGSGWHIAARRTDLELPGVRRVLGHRLDREVLGRHLGRRVGKELRRERGALLARVRVHDRGAREGDRRKEREEERANGLHDCLVFS